MAMNDVERDLVDGLEGFAAMLKDMNDEAEQYEPCMSLDVSREGKCVELLLDTARSVFHEWIPSGGGDIGLLRCRESRKVVGICLPLLRNNLCVHHDGPIRINAGFRKGDTQ